LQLTSLKEFLNNKYNLIIGELEEEEWTWNLEKKRLFVKSGGGKSSIILRDSKLNKLFKVVEFFYPVR